MICYRCQKDLQLGEKVMRGDSCSHCHVDARVCKNCEFYDTNSYNECREPSADRVTDKEKANFCDYFQPHTRGPGGAPKKPDPKSAAEALFKKR